MVNTFVPRMFSLFNDRGLIRENKDGVPVMGGESLVTYGSKIFKIFSDGSVIESDDFAAIGIGSEYALASLYTTTDISDPYERLCMALRAGIDNVIDADYPMFVTDTKSSEIKKVEK